MSIQQTIIKGIKEQLFFNDYLVLPGFGGFVLKSKPAHFSASGGLLVPPAKSVSFNSQLKLNDGVLSFWLQNALKCNVSEASVHLNDFSEYCSGILAAKRRLSLASIGFFYLDFENNICFEPQQDSNFLTNSFGLTSVSIKELEPTLAEPKKETLFVDRTLHQTEPAAQPLRVRRSYSKMVTPLLFSILFVSVLGVLVNNSSFKGELKSSLFGSEIKGAYAPLHYSELTLINNPAKIPTYVTDANGIAAIELDETKKIAVIVFENKFNSGGLNYSKSALNTISNGSNFEIVLGCFTVLENANRMVHKLSSKNIKAAVTGKNNKGMYVVSNGNYKTKEAALSQLLEVKENFPNAWIKKGN